jgi:C4-dicarboxylate-specific signal transduction histidine kinase
MNHYAGERKMIERKSKKARNEFEKRIKDQTDESNRTIDSLNIEVAERKRVEV